MEFNGVFCNIKHGSGVGLGPFILHVWYNKYGQVLVRTCVLRLMCSTYIYTGCTTLYRIVIGSKLQFGD